MELMDFINRYVGKEVDFDGYYGAQCVDLFRQYCQDVLYVGHTGAVEGAKDLYVLYNQLGKEKSVFNRLTKSQDPKFGDVAVFDATKTNPYGHVAIVMASDSKNKRLMVFEQLGGTKNPAARIAWRTKEYLLGYLSKKE